MESDSSEEMDIMYADSSELLSHLTHDSHQQNSFFLYVLCAFSIIGGFLFGYDTGVISGAMLVIKNEFHLNSIRQESIVSITIGTAGISSIFGGYINNKIGRKPAIIISTFFFMVGSLMLGLSHGYAMLLIGRALLGVGIGLESCTIPMYISEVAPSNIRGKLVTLHNLSIATGQFIASIIAGIFSYNTKNGWRYMLGLAAVPAFIQLIAFMFMPESPRWLFSKAKTEKAQKAYKKIYGVFDDVQLDEIYPKSNVDANVAIPNEYGILEMLKIKHIRKALYVGSFLQLTQQLIGINSVMYYGATILAMSGISSISNAIWLASITAGVNMTFSIVSLLLVERMGRRKLTLISLFGTFVSLLLLSLSFRLQAMQSVPVTEIAPGSMKSHCIESKTCDQCTLKPLCGFCYGYDNHSDILSSCININGSISINSCNIINEQESMTFKLTTDYCPNGKAWLSLAGMILYLSFFEIGMGSLPWTINSEIYPTWARSTGNSVATSVNWFSNLLISLTFLSLAEILTSSGVFLLFGGFAFVGFLIIFKVLPETKGIPLEQIENIFKSDSP